MSTAVKLKYGHLSSKADEIMNVLRVPVSGGR